MSHIKAVDQVTQFEAVVSVQHISERYLIPALQQLFDILPFEVLSFHSDNGCEYVNYRVAELLEKLRIEFTKSRARHSIENALVECKNGHVLRETARTRTYSSEVCGGTERIPSTVSEPVCELSPTVSVCTSGDV